MLSEFLQDRASRYVSGDLTVSEHESFEVLLEYHHELRAHVAGLQEVVTALMMAGMTPLVAPPVELKARLLDALDAQSPKAEPDGLVVADSDGLVEWVNPVFMAMCGYSLEEIRGRKPGHLLQGPGTDPAPVGRIREALQERRPCRETLVNYHKDGTRYRVDVRITPILDDARQPVYFVAREQKLPEDEAILAV